MRFRCLLKHRVLNYHPSISSKIINSCVILHNLCIDANLPLLENMEGYDFEMFDTPINEEQVNLQGNHQLQLGRLMQRRLINHY